MNTESNWSSENRNQEPVTAESPQRTARYSWDWPENLVPEWTPPPGLMARARAQAGFADGNHQRDGHASEDEPEAGERDGGIADQEPADREVADLESTDPESADDEPIDQEPSDEWAEDERADEPIDYEPMDGSAGYESADGPADFGSAQGSADQPADDRPTDEGPADDRPADEGPADDRPADEGPADDGSADDEDGWPGVAPAAGWFLHAPEQNGWGGTAPIGGDAVPLPRQAPDSSWPETAESPAPAHPDGAGAAVSANAGNGSSSAGAWSAPADGSPAEPVVSATRALWGRAGGPGFRPGRPGPGSRRAAAATSPWQKSQGLWREEGIAWEQRPAESARQPLPPAAAFHPHQELKPSPLPPRGIPAPLSAPVPASPSPFSPRPAGRHAGVGSIPPEPVNGAWHTPAPLSAPVFADSEPAPREGRSAVQVEDGPALPWDRSLPWERAAGTQDTVAPASSRREALDTLLLEEEPPGPWQPDGRRNRATRRTATIAVPVIVLIAVAALALALLTGHGPRFGQLAASQPRNAHPALPQSLTAAAFGAYPGEQQRAVFQTINRVVASGNTIVTMGSETTDGVARQQFFVSTNGGATWRLAVVQSPGGGQAPVGHPASLLAGGPGGWAAIGPQALWTSQDGQSWTLAATHGITPQLPGDSVWVITRTAQGFLAAGAGSAGGGSSQAVIWTSPDGVTWNRMTAAQLGLAAAGERVLNISHATWLGDDTVISGEVAAGGTTYSGAWLSTNGGSAWTRVTIPADHGAGTSITGLAFDSAGLIAVRPGRSASGADDGVAYFSPNGRAWQYAATIDAAGGWTPGVVKGSAYGFVVTGTSAAGQLVAYTSTGRGATWQPTGSLGNAADESVVGATVAPAGTIIAVGYTTGSKIDQQATFLEANTAGSVWAVSLAGIPGGIIPELTVNGLAVADGQQVAVGSADGYPAVWRKASGNSWTLVTPLTSVPAGTGLTALTGVAHGSAGWLAVGAPGPYVATSADGTTWQFATGPGSITDNLAGVSNVAVAAGPAGYIIVGKLIAPGGSCVADVWWSPNLTDWVRAHDVNDATGSSQVLAVAASAHGFVSAGSHEGRPAVWTTTDGRSWTTVVLPMPAGATGAALQQIAISGDRVAALGQETTAAGTLPFAELSVNGGTSWQQVPFASPGPDTAFTALIAGPGGFAATGPFGEPGQREVGVWTSANGTVWTPAQVSGLTGAPPGGSYLLTALAPTGSAVTGIGSIATQQGLEPFTVTIPAG
jgi:hypothetical protein